jgi:hypothetical protein
MSKDNAVCLESGIEVRTACRLAPDGLLRVVLEVVLLLVAGAEYVIANDEQPDTCRELRGRECASVVQEKPALDAEGERDEDEVTPDQHPAEAAGQR